MARRLVVAFASAVLLVGASRTVAQSGPSGGSELGPDLGPPDSEAKKRWKAHRPRQNSPRRPSPPDGPDQDPDGRPGGQAETAVAVDPLDEKHVVACAVDLQSGSAVTRWYTTFDGGQTWTTDYFRNEPGYALNGDCAVVITPQGIPVIAAMQYFGAGGSAVYAYRSLDGGLTWLAGVSVDLDSANDKIQAAVDLSNGPNRGQICLAWDRFFTAQGDTIYAATSSDDGATFQNVQRVDDTNGRQGISPDVAYGPNSEIWVAWADRGRFDVMVDKSTDGGVTWGTDIKASDYSQVPSPIPGSFFRMFDIFSIAVDYTSGPHSGNVYVVFHRWNVAAPQHADISCVRTEDGGTTWNRVNVNKGDTTLADQVMPFAQVDPHGNLDVAFYDRRLDPNNYLLWTWVARSSNGGRSFAEFPASDVGWDHGASDSAWYIGDYLGLDVSDHTVRPFYADGRTGSVDVGTDELHLDLHTLPSEIPASTGGAIDFTLNVGPNHVGENYWLLGSFATTPGLDFGSVHLPLEYDALFDVTLHWANTSYFQNSLGQLDNTGSAAIRLDSNGAVPPSLIGTDLYFAAFVWAANPVYATNATKVSIVP